MRLPLAEVVETEALPPRASLAEFLADANSNGCLEYLPGRWRPASAWYSDAIGPMGGDCTPAWWSDDPIINCNPVVFCRIASGYYMPRFGVVVASTGQVFKATVDQARYRTPDLSLLPGVTAASGSAYLSVPADIPRRSRIAVAMPWGALHNYGHFVLDCLPIAATMAKAGLLNRYTAAFPPLQPWQARHLALAGIADPVQLDADIYEVDNLVFCNSMSSFLHHPNVNYSILREQQLERAVKTGLSFPALYLARPEGLKRTLLSEAALQTRLRSEGFEIVRPEEYAVDEQIEIFNGASIVVGCAGAAFANTLYCRQGTQVVEIIPLRMVEEKIVSGVWVYNISALIGLRWRPYFCRASWSSAEQTGRPELDFSFDLDVDDLAEYIHGLRVAA